MAVRTLLGVFVVLFSLVPSSGAAQEARGTIQGRVVDSSGAAIPGASVEVLNIATGVVMPTTTNAEGSYRVPFLIPGNYRVTVFLEGFSKYVSDTIAVHVADLLTVDALLKIGALTDTVTVTPGARMTSSTGLPSRIGSSAIRRASTT